MINISDVNGGDYMKIIFLQEKITKSIFIKITSFFD